MPSRRAMLAGLAAGAALLGMPSILRAQLSWMGAGS